MCAFFERNKVIAGGLRDWATKTSVNWLYESLTESLNQSKIRPVMTANDTSNRASMLMSVRVSGAQASFTP